MRSQTSPMHGRMMSLAIIRMLSLTTIAIPLKIQIPSLGTQVSLSGAKLQADIGTQLDIIKECDLGPGPGGSFRFTFRPERGGRAHFMTKPVPIVLVIRDKLSDWNAERPTPITPRRIGGTLAS